MRPYCTQVGPRSPSDLGTDVEVASFHLQVGEANLAQCLTLSRHSINESFQCVLRKPFQETEAQQREGNG